MSPSNKRAVSILVIGSEITHGYVHDTNTGFIASELFKLGIPVQKVVTIPDEKTQIISALKELVRSGNFVITTGGLGPTDDDLTVNCLCSLLKTNPVYSRPCLSKIRKMAALNKKDSEWIARVNRQCRIPEGSVALPNKAGLAPGIYIGNPGIISLPGFPVEIRSIWPAAVKKLAAEIPARFISRYYPIWEIPESTIYENLGIPDSIEYGNHSLPWGSRFFIKTGIDNQKILKSFDKKIRNRYAPNLIENPVNAFFYYLKEARATLATIESCTAGLAAKILTDIPGSSDVYPGSIITYSNEIKTELVGVSPATIQKYGAVSRETAREMALGGSKKLKADITISITGIAGPGGGSPEKPVGTVYFGIYDRRESRCYTGSGFFPFGRDRFRNAAVYSIYLSLYHRYIWFSREQDWLESPQGKNYRIET